MKRIAALGMALLLIALVVVGVRSGCSYVDTGNPESVAKAAILALDSYNVENVCQYFTGSAYGQMAEGLDTLYTTSANVIIDNVVVAMTAQTGSIARLYISYDLSRDIYGYQDTRHVAKTIQAVDQNGVWYLNSPI